MNQPRFAALTAQNLPEALSLWQASTGLQLREDDEPEALARFLARNPGLSLGVWQGTRLIAAALAGHDGRRGYLYHFAVADDYQRQGIGSHLARLLSERLQAEGIRRLHLLTRHDNPAALDFWRSQGWLYRDDVALLSLVMD